MALYAIQVVGQTPQKGVLALPATYDPFIRKQPIEWKSYGDACSCLFQSHVFVARNKLECQGSCKTKTAFWTTIAKHRMGLDDLTKKLQTVFGIQFNMTEIAAFQDENGKWVDKWKADQDIKKAYRIEGIASDGDDKDPPPPDADEGITQEVLHRSSGDDKDSLFPDAEEGTNRSQSLGGDNTNSDLPPPPYSLSEGQPINLQVGGLNLGQQQPTQARLIDKELSNKLVALNPNAVELGLWKDIFKHVKDNQLSNLAQLIASNPNAVELGLWKDIFKYVKDNQLSNLAQLIALNPNAVELGLWKDIFKHVKDNQLSNLAQLIASNPNAVELGRWKDVL